MYAPPSGIISDLENQLRNSKAGEYESYLSDPNAKLEMTLQVLLRDRL